MVLGMKAAAEGSVSLLERTEASWKQTAVLQASDGEYSNLFGYSVALEGDIAVVGAVSTGDFQAQGAAYVFERQPDGAWIETAKLLPPDGAWAFGWAVDVDGERIAVGAKGAGDLGGGKGRVVVFERDGASWVKKATILPTIAAPGDGFGASLDLEGERLVVGAPYAWTGTSAGTGGYAFVFERQASGLAWLQTAVLSPDDLNELDQFGRGVALHGDRIVVGAPLHDLPMPFSGATYVYDRLEGGWTQTAKLSPTPGTLLTDFGWSVDVEDGRIVVGSPSDLDIASSAGAVYLFEEQASGGWNEIEKIHGSDTEAGDGFGHALDLEGSEVLVGAPFLWALIGHPGQAFLFDLEPEGPSLIADAASVTLSTGGEQGLQLGACGAHAGDVYVVAGSATGASPGFALGAHAIPLNPDAYFHFALQHPNQPPLASSLGVLDAWGRGEAAFALPAGLDPALAGVVLHHAFVVLDAATLQLEAVSPAVPVALVP